MATVSDVPLDGMDHGEEIAEALRWFYRASWAERVIMYLLGLASSMVHMQQQHTYVDMNCDNRFHVDTVAQLVKRRVCVSRIDLTVRRIAWPLLFVLSAMVVVYLMTAVGFILGGVIMQLPVAVLAFGDFLYVTRGLSLRASVHLGLATTVLALAMLVVLPGTTNPVWFCWAMLGLFHCMILFWGKVVSWYVSCSNFGPLHAECHRLMLVSTARLFVPNHHVATILSERSDLRAEWSACSSVASTYCIRLSALAIPDHEKYLLHRDMAIVLMAVVTHRGFHAAALLGLASQQGGSL